MGLNLHSVVRGAIQAVNPDTTAIWQQSLGYRIQPNGKQATSYNNVFGVPIQVQGISGAELQHLNYLNMEGVFRKVYLFGSIDGLVRATLKGGDLLIFPDWTPAPTLNANGQQTGVTFPLRFWKVVEIAERWPSIIGAGWSAAIVALQDDSTDFIIDSNGNYVSDSWGNLLVAA